MILCASCARRFSARRQGQQVCTYCGHVHAGRKSQTLRTAAAASARKPSAVRPAPSLPKVTILEPKS